MAYDGIWFSIEEAERVFNAFLYKIFRREGKKPSPTYDFIADFLTKEVLGWLITFPYELLAKYVARGVYHINGVASASVVGLLAGLTLPSPYKEFAYGGGFTSCSTNAAFTIKWEAFICFVFITVNNAFRPILNGLGGKLGMTVYVAGHISALFIVAFQSGTFETTCLDPTARFGTWVDFWFHRYNNGSIVTNVFVDIAYVLACALAGCVTLWLHVHFDKNSNPVVASSLVSLAAGLYLPPSTNPLNFFIWTGSFVGMSAPAAKPGAYALVHFDNKPQVYSDMVSLFITGIIAGLIQIAIWWTAPGIGGKFGFIAHCACLPMHLFTKWRNNRRERKAALKDDGLVAKKGNYDDDDSYVTEMKPKAAVWEDDDEEDVMTSVDGLKGASGDEPDPEGDDSTSESSSFGMGEDAAAGVFGGRPPTEMRPMQAADHEPEEEEDGVIVERLEMPQAGSRRGDESAITRFFAVMMMSLNGLQERPPTDEETEGCSSSGSSTPECGEGWDLSAKHGVDPWLLRQRLLDLQEHRRRRRRADRRKRPSGVFPAAFVVTLVAAATWISMVDLTVSNLATLMAALAAFALGVFLERRHQQLTATERTASIHPSTNAEHELGEEWRQTRIVLYYLEITYKVKIHPHPHSERDAASSESPLSDTSGLPIILTVVDVFQATLCKMQMRYAVSLSSILLAKYAAEEVYGVSGVASASTIGILAGLTLPSPYRETAYGASFVSASTNGAFTIQWEPFICFVYVCVVFSLRHALLGIGGKLGMMAYVAGHISALFIVLVGAGSWSTTSLDPDDAFESWVDFWFRSHADGNVLISTIITICFVIACGTASSLTLWLHLHFDNHLSPVVASSLVSLAAGLFLPPSTNPLMFFIWTGSFVGMSGPAASPGAYSIITVKDSPVLSDVTSIFLTGLWAGILLISFWWWTGEIGGRYGFIAFVACTPLAARVKAVD
ncbi:hypothetical protein FOL46_007720, partial [Perkinsus olseni]